MNFSGIGSTNFVEGDFSRVVSFYVELFRARELWLKKILDSLCRFLVELLVSNGEIMFFQSVKGKSRVRLSTAFGKN